MLPSFEKSWRRSGRSWSRYMLRLISRRCGSNYFVGSWANWIPKGDVECTSVEGTFTWFSKCSAVIRGRLNSIRTLSLERNYLLIFLSSRLWKWIRLFLKIPLMPNPAAQAPPQRLLQPACLLLPVWILPCTASRTTSRRRELARLAGLLLRKLLML